MIILSYSDFSDSSRHLQNKWIVDILHGGQHNEHSHVEYLPKVCGMCVNL